MPPALRKAYDLVDKGRRKRFLIVAFLAVIVSGLEAISALLILVLMRLILEPDAVPAIPIIGTLDSVFPELGYQSAVLMFALAFASFYLVRSIMFLVQTYSVARLAEHTGALLAKRLVSGYLSMPYIFHLRRNSAELLRNAYDNVQQVQSAVFSQFGVIVAEVVMVAALLAVLLVASPSATLAVVVLMGVAFAVVMRVVQPRLKVLGRERNSAAKAAIQHLQQSLGGVRDVKILGRERDFAESFSRARLAMARPQYLRASLSYVPRIVIETAFLGFILIVLVTAVFREETSDILATLGLFAYAGLRLQPSVQKIANALNSFRFAEAAVEDLRVDLEEMSGTELESQEAAIPIPFSEEIRFNCVSLAYDMGEPALRGVSCSLWSGQSIGISGASGGGKTTFIDVLCGLLAPTDGKLFVDGLDISDDVRGWQRNIGAVHQTSFLIDDTLRGNIAFGVSASDVNEDRLDECLRIAELQDVVRELPEGLDTIVGERGVRLSGGQRQRVTIARAVYRSPKLLILDEGTSALDNTTEAKVIQNLQSLRGSTTLIMVAHRLATIRDCDRILVFEGGQIVGDGAYDLLLATNDSFRALAAGAPG